MDESILADPDPDIASTTPQTRTIDHAIAHVYDGPGAGRGSVPATRGRGRPLVSTLPNLDEFTFTIRPGNGPTCSAPDEASSSVLEVGQRRPALDELCFPIFGDVYNVECDVVFEVQRKELPFAQI